MPGMRYFQVASSTQIASTSAVFLSSAVVLRIQVAPPVEEPPGRSAYRESSHRTKAVHGYLQQLIKA